MILFVLLFVTTKLIGQQYWSKTFEVFPANEQVWQMTIMDGDIFIGAIAPCHGDFKACYILVFIDSTGEILRTHILSDPEYQFYPTSTPGTSASEDSYRLTLHSDYFDDIYQSYMVYLDKDELTIDSADAAPLISYDIYRAIGHFVLSNACSIEFGQEYEPATKRSLTALHYRNKHGARIWSRNIGEQFLFNLCKSQLVEMTPNKIAGIAQGCSDCEYPTMKPYVFAVDTLGDLVFDIHLDTMIAELNLGEIPKIAGFDDSTVVIAWYHIDKNERRQPYLMRLHESGEILWKTALPNLDPTLDMKIINDLIRTQNGDYIGVGWRVADQLYPNKGAFDIGWAFRMNAEGVILWDRIYYEPRVKFPAYQFFKNVVEDDEGNLYFSGEVRDSIVGEISNIPNTNFWLVKVGPDGCIEPGCTEQVILLPTEETFRILPENYLSVYPNPVRDMLQVSWEDLPVGAAFLQVHDISGRLLGTWPVTYTTGTLSLDVRTWPKGVVFLSLRSEHWMTLPVKVVRE